jgi:hypothetical protein
MEDAGHEGAAAVENGVEGEGYGIVKAATADWEGTQPPIAVIAGISSAPPRTRRLSLYRAGKVTPSCLRGGRI